MNDDEFISRTYWNPSKEKMAEYQTREVDMAKEKIIASRSKDVFTIHSTQTMVTALAEIRREGRYTF